MLLRSAERHLVPTEGNLTEAEGYLRSAREHLEAAEAQLAPAEAPPMSTVEAVVGTPHSGEAGGQRGHHQRPQERGGGSAMAWDAHKTAPQNTPAEQKAAGKQQTAAGRCEREQIGRVADAAGGAAGQQLPAEKSLPRGFTAVHEHSGHPRAAELGT